MGFLEIIMDQDTRDIGIVLVADFVLFFVLFVDKE